MIEHTRGFFGLSVLGFDDSPLLSNGTFDVSFLGGD
jgi:hypothetical protein